MRQITWPVNRDSKTVTYWQLWIRDPKLPIHYTTFVGLWWWLRVVCRWQFYHCVVISQKTKSKIGPKNGPILDLELMAFFGGKEKSEFKILVLWPRKGTSLRGTLSFDVFCVKICAGVLAVGNWKNLPKN